MLKSVATLVAAMGVVSSAYAADLQLPLVNANYENLRTACQGEPVRGIGRQTLPDKLLVSCTDVRTEWVLSQQDKQLRNTHEVSGLVKAGDKAQARSSGEFDLDPTPAQCPVYEKVRVIDSWNNQVISCADVLAHQTLEQLCSVFSNERRARAAADPNSVDAPEREPTGEKVLFCDGKHVQPPKQEQRAQDRRRTD